MDDRLEPLPELARQLLDAERTPPEPSADVRNRIAERMSPLFVSSAVAAGLVAADAAGLASDGATLASASGGIAKTTTALLLQSKLAVAALAFGVGAGAGVTVHAVATAPETAVVATTASAVRGLPPRSAAPFPLTPFEPLPTATVSASASSTASTSVAPTAAPTGSGALKRERSLIDTARMAILRGDKAAALRALESHAREFPNGQHASERDALQRRARALETPSP
jgi:hypothetical protein